MSLKVAIFLKEVISIWVQLRELEKFFKIVFAMKPNIRIGRRVVLLSLFLFWSLCVTFAVLPAFNVGRMTYISVSLTLPTDQQLFKVGIATGVQLVLIIIQLTSFFLYVPIFIVAKRSGGNVGIKREAAIAKKIALLLFLSFFFFFFLLFPYCSLFFLLELNIIIAVFYEFSAPNIFIFGQFSRKMKLKCDT